MYLVNVDFLLYLFEFCFKSLPFLYTQGHRKKKWPSRIRVNYAIKIYRLSSTIIIMTKAI